MRDEGHSRNRHPTDRLGEVRAQIRALQKEEADLKQQCLALWEFSDDCQGEDFTLKVVTQTRHDLDKEALKQALGADVLDRFMVETKITVVQVKAR